MSAITVKDDGSLDITPSSMSALRNSIFPGADDESIIMAVEYCVARKLDVFKKPCHIVRMSVKDPKTGYNVKRDVIMPGIYELRTTAFRTGEMAGMDEPIFGDEIEYLGVRAPEYCKMTVYRAINGVRYAFSHTEYFVEICSTFFNEKTQSLTINSMWTKRPRGQLAKCAEAGALRKAFPDEMGGIMTSDEVSEMDNIPAPEIDVTPQPDISDKISKIKQLVQETNSDEDKFLSFIGVQSYQGITADIADRALSALNAKIKKAQSIEVEEKFEPEVIDI